jgi:VanZ family protein
MPQPQRLRWQMSLRTGFALDLIEENEELSSVFLQRVFFFCTLAAVLLLTLTPDDTGALRFANDKIEHFGAFFVLAIIGMNGWPERPLRLAFILLAIGGAIEVLQATPLIHRDAEFHDWLADAIGTGVGLTAQLLVRYVIRSPPS